MQQNMTQNFSFLIGDTNDNSVVNSEVHKLNVEYSSVNN